MKQIVNYEGILYLLDEALLYADIPHCIFEDSYGDGVALVNNQSYSSYEELACDFDLEFTKYLKRSSGKITSRLIDVVKASLAPYKSVELSKDDFSEVVANTVEDLLDMYDIEDNEDVICSALNISAFHMLRDFQNDAVNEHYPN